MKKNNSDFNYLESCSVRELKQVLNNDPILVWLDRNAGEHQYQRDKSTPYDFGAFVGNKTKMMKEHMLQFLEETFPGEIYTIPSFFFPIIGRTSAGTNSFDSKGNEDEKRNHRESYPL